MTEAGARKVRHYENTAGWLNSSPSSLRDYFRGDEYYPAIGGHGDVENSEAGSVRGSVGDGRTLTN